MIIWADSTTQSTSGSGSVVAKDNFSDHVLSSKADVDVVYGGAGDGSASVTNHFAADTTPYAISVKCRYAFSWSLTFHIELNVSLSTRYSLNNGGSWTIIESEYFSDQSDTGSVSLITKSIPVQWVDLLDNDLANLQIRAAVSADTVGSGSSVTARIDAHEGWLEVSPMAGIGMGYSLV